jgi:hypothetical protein
VLVLSFHTQQPPPKLNGVAFLWNYWGVCGIKKEALTPPYCSVIGSITSETLLTLLTTSETSETNSETSETNALLPLAPLVAHPIPE